MESNKGGAILNYAMYYGLVLGAFWGVKYFFKAYETVWSPMIYIYYILNAITFLLIYVFYFKYRDHESGVMQRRLRCVLFVVFLCFFASIIESAAMFLHLEILDPTYYETHIGPQMHAIAEALPYTPEMKAEFLRITSIKMLPALLNPLSGITLGVVLGVILALLIGKKQIN